MLEGKRGWFVMLGPNPGEGVRFNGAFAPGDHVEKISGAGWRGHVVGFYSTDLTPIGYAVESDAHPGSVQIYPEKALRLVETEK